MPRPVHTEQDIDATYRGTPVEKLLLAHNFGVSFAGEGPELIIVTCMDWRVRLRLSGLHAFEVRTAGASPVPVFSNIAFARVALDLTTICIIGHTECAMTNMSLVHESVSDGLPRTDHWPPRAAGALADALINDFGIGDPITGTLAYAQWLRERLPSCLIAPLLYDVGDQQLSQLD